MWIVCWIIISVKITVILVRYKLYWMPLKLLLPVQFQYDLCSRHKLKVFPLLWARYCGRPSKHSSYSLMKLCANVNNIFLIKEKPSFATVYSFYIKFYRRTKKLPVSTGNCLKTHNVNKTRATCTCLSILRHIQLCLLVLYSTEWITSYSYL